MSGGSNLPLAGTPEQQLADPLHLFPNADNAGQPLSPGAVPSTLPNLGAGSLLPMLPYGKFMAPNTSGGGFNAMAAQGAGSLFNPSAGAPSWQALMATMARAAPHTAPGASLLTPAIQNPSIVRRAKP